MALNDTVATGVLKFLTEHGVKVPDKVSLMGFDGTAHSEFSLIGISTIETPLYEMGRKAVEMIDTAVLQLLFAFTKKVQAGNHQISWKNPSDEFVSRADLLGLSHHLGIN